MASCCDTARPNDNVERPTEWLKLGLGAVVAGQSMVFGLALNLSPPTGTARLWMHLVLAAGAVLVFLLVGLPLAATALKALFAGRMVVEQLFLAGIAGAFAASVQSTLSGHGSIYYEVVAVLLAIYTLGSVLGESRRREALASAEALGREFSSCRRLSCCGKETLVPASEIQPGDRVRVLPGDGVPVDGILREGVAMVRESALTGEPFPVVRRAGDPVRAGSHVLDGALVVEATSRGSCREIDRLIAAVRDARSNPAPVQREADRLVSWFLPLVLTVASATFVYWVGRVGAGAAWFNALAVLLVACPCAMGLATPLGIWSALGALAGRGLVCRGGDVIEKLARVDAACFDKTGTLGEEELAVVDFVVAPGFERAEVRALAGVSEKLSAHPVARALAPWAEAGEAMVAEQIQVLPGVGISATVRRPEGKTVTVMIGNEGVLPGPQPAGFAEIEAAFAPGIGRRIYVVVNGALAGAVVLREVLRASARETLDMFARAGIPCRVLTGDSAESASAHGLANVSAGLSPEEKMRSVEEWAASGQRVLVVGDGINDSPAMSRAYASVAVGNGSDMARESADAILFSRDLRVLAEGIKVCRETLGAIRANLAFAAVYNVAGMGLAASGMLHPVVSALLMFASSGTVTWRALRHAEKLRGREDQDFAGVPDGQAAWGAKTEGAVA